MSEFRHREIAFVPVRTIGTPAFALEHIRYTRKEAVDAAVRGSGKSWHRLKLLGWRMVRIEIRS